MQSEIKFLLDLVLNHKLPPTAKKLCLERIGEVEASLISPTVSTQSAFKISPLQAPSTQRLLEAQAEPAPMAAAPVMPVKRIVGGEVSTGVGTKGPRKF